MILKNTATHKAKQTKSNEYDQFAVLHIYSSSLPYCGTNPVILHT